MECHVQIGLLVRRTALSAEGYDVLLDGAKANRGGDGHQFYGAVER